MKIAFASCMCTRVCKNQPVWEQIAVYRPDYLVLLGDSIYLDILFPTTHPQEMTDDDFGKHIHTLYSELLAQPQFSSLIHSLPTGRVFSIWDDHDFLWNDMCGDGGSGIHAIKEKVRISTAHQEAFRVALAAGLAPGSYPATYVDPVFWNVNQPSLTTPTIKLAPDVYLHLFDVRTWRTGTWLVEQSKRTLLGQSQRQKIETAIKSAQNDALHLLASGSTMSDWKHFATDLDWLLRLAGDHRTLMLSGDIHRNDVDAFYAGKFPLHEATSSGAAVKDAVIVGKRQQNFGLLEIAPNTVDLRLFHMGREQTSLARTYDRDTWLPR